MVAIGPRAPIITVLAAPIRAIPSEVKKLGRTVEKIASAKPSP